MLIPRFWARESGASTDPQGKRYQAGYRVLATDLHIDLRAQATQDFLSGEIVEEHDRVCRALSDLPLA